VYTYTLTPSTVVFVFSLISVDNTSRVLSSAYTLYYTVHGGCSVIRHPHDVHTKGIQKILCACAVLDGSLGAIEGV
jgi:hypothetical protein